MKRKRSVVTGRVQAARTPKRVIRGQSSTSARSGRIVRPSAPTARSGMGAAGSVVSEAVPIEASVVDLSVDLARHRPGALILRNPIMAAAGPFGYGVEYEELIDLEALGGICSKGTTLKARIGNPPPRIAETAGGLLNSIGLQNPGIVAVLERYAPRWAGWDVPVLINIAGESTDDYAAIARALDGVPGVAGVELNISCPNVGRGGIQFALDPDGAAAVTAAVRRATDLPLIVKLSPAALDVRAIAGAVEEAGADAISAVNTLSGMAMDRDARSPALGNTYGGLSGPALKPIALRVVYEVAQAVRIPVVAIGGVTALEDVLDYLIAGASAVQVGTALFADPALPVRLVDELRRWCAAQGLASHREVVGAGLPGRRGRPSIKGAEYRP